MNTKLFYFNSYANLFYRFSTNSATFKQKNAFFRIKIRFQVKIRISSPDGRIRVQKTGICSHPVNKFCISLITCYLNDFGFKKSSKTKKYYLCGVPSAPFGRPWRMKGEMAERSNAAVLKTVVRLPANRGFESLFLRNF